MLVDQIYAIKRNKPIGQRISTLTQAMEDCYNAARRCDDEQMRIMHLYNRAQLERSLRELTGL